LQRSIRGGPFSSLVPAGKLREVALMLKAIHAQESLDAARRKAAEVVARLREMRLGKAAELVQTAVDETLVGTVRNLVCGAWLSIRLRRIDLRR
jgi:putative transposase